MITIELIIECQGVRVINGISQECSDWGATKTYKEKVTRGTCSQDSNNFYYDRMKKHFYIFSFSRFLQNVQLHCSSIE